MKKILLLSLFLLSLAACEKPALGTLTGSVNRPVVEGFLQPGSTPVVQVKNSSHTAAPTPCNCRLKAFYYRSETRKPVSGTR